MLWVAFLAAVSAAPYQWRNVEIVGGGFVTGIIPHPSAKDLRYARTDIGGAYRWEPGKGRWKPLLDMLSKPDWNLTGIESVGLDPNDPNRVYLACGTYDNDWGTNGAILRSGDRGETWKRTDLPFKNGGNMPGRSMGERLAVDPTDGRNVYFGTRNSGLWRSLDRGRTWSRVETFPKVVRNYGQAVRGAGWERVPPDGYGVVWVLFDRSTVYAGLARKTDSLYRSVDRGRTWRLVPGQPKGLMPHQAKLGADRVLTVVYADAPGPNDVKDGAVWRFDLRAGRWSNITPEKPGGANKFGYGGVSVRGRTILVSTLCRWSQGDTVFRSEDGGRSWVSVKDNAVRDSSVSPYLNWGRPEPEFGHWIGDVEIDPHDPDQVWYVTGATIWGTRSFRDVPSRWVPMAQGIEETAVLDLVSPPEGAHVISALGDIGGFAHFDLHRSPPGGIWTNPVLSTTTDLDFAEAKPRLVVRVGNASRSPRGAVSEDGGTTWEPLVTDPPGGRGGGTVAMSADASTIVWMAGQGAHRTRDRGRTWEACAGAPAEGTVVSDRVDPLRFTIASPQGVFASRNGGATFGKVAASVGVGKMAAPFGEAGHLWMRSEKGLFRSIDGGGTWRKVGPVASSEAVGFGRAETAGGYPTLYLIGVIGREVGVFRSTTQGETWVRINDTKTGFATMNNITGDPKRFGRVYLGTNGRGVLVGDQVVGLR